MIINVSYDSSITSSPLASSIETAITDAVTFYEQAFTNPVTINLDFGYGEVDGQQIPSTSAAENIPYGEFVSYATLQSALAGDSVLLDSETVPVSSLLPATDPTDGGEFWITNAEQKALGLLPADGSEVDGYVGLSAGLTEAWNQNVVSASDQIDAVGALEHEMSEEMGRLGYVGIGTDFDPITPDAYGLIDLFRYSSSNGLTTTGRILTPGPGYFSLNGVTIPTVEHDTAISLGSFGSSVPAEFNDPTNGGDVADWTPEFAGGDSFGSADYGVAGPVGSTDISILEALGWTRSTLPDLTINNVNVSSATVEGDSHLTVNYELDNIGFSAIGASQTAIVLSTSSTISIADDVLGVVSDASLAGDTSRVGTTTVTIPASLMPGTYYVGAIADDDFSLGETDYTNNTSTNVVEITVSAAPLPVGTIQLHGTQSQYVIADSDGSLYIQDTVAGRDGTRVLAGVEVMQFSDGTGIFDPTGTAEVVARVYTAVLDRAPDVAGLQAWTADIVDSHATLSGVANAFAASPEFIQDYGSLSDSAFVNQLYVNVLGRQADAAGAQYWDGLLSSGTGRGAVALAFAESPEDEARTASTDGDNDNAEVYRLYEAALGRAPDAAGQAHWSAELAAGDTITQIAQNLVGTAEFQQKYAGLSVSDFVTGLYQTVLDRAPDATGLHAWTNALNDGESEASVLVGFSDSTEFRAATAAATHGNWVFIPS